jgi:hypothetical protein
MVNFFFPCQCHEGEEEGGRGEEKEAGTASGSPSQIVLKTCFSGTETCFQYPPPPLEGGNRGVCLEGGNRGVCLGSFFFLEQLYVYMYML